ncbi:MAG: hypothetical protein A2Z47_11315 [Thermodesulfovibrio sp. RBG_19FT_COMBO_42_12]|nr:MAG: hypothetical protein A2Z47_11315 [Thermodesulfovibrio sp. RBG_19FT_COMBO_42_12]
MDIIRLIRESAERNLIYTIHALDEMNAEDEIITTDEVRYVVLHGEIIEDYPEDKRGHSCLMFGIPHSKRPIHIVCAPKEDYLAVITAYVPSLEKWESNFKTRRKK